jgi:hypothetical protein
LVKELYLVVCLREHFWNQPKVLRRASSCPRWSERVEENGKSQLRVRVKEACEVPSLRLV